jgi:lysozyme family protein
MAPSRFEHCLCHLLLQETGYAQPHGGPFRRNARGSSVIPAKPDGRWYDDDPDDTGGRTAAGILQREYDPWRRAKGQAIRDVWLIEDDEIRAIYHSKYWEMSGANRAPVGVDMALFDFAVLCGIGTAVRNLQRALGVKVDGVYGPATHDALLAVEDRQALINDLCDLRRAYLKKCRTFWKHGKGWMKRVDRVEWQALTEASRKPTPAAARPDIEEETPSRKAPDPTPASMATSTTGNTAIGLGAAASYFGVKEAAGALATAASGGALTLDGVVAALLSNEAFWLAAFAVGGAAYIWFERRRKLLMGT